MSARTPRFEIVRTDAGWHARIVAGNGLIVFSSESYTRRRAALSAVSVALEVAGYAANRPPRVEPGRVVGRHFIGDYDVSFPLTDVDERTTP